MENALAVANFFIKRAQEAGEPITPMKLVKLVYIAHGWHLGLTGNPLLSEEPQAWKYGPVFPTVYHQFKHLKSEAVKVLASAFIAGQFVFAPLPNKEVTPFLDSIWSIYNGYSAIELSDLTHQVGTPWYETWEVNGGKNRQGEIIPEGLIKAHYQHLAEVNAKAQASDKKLPMFTNLAIHECFAHLRTQWEEKHEYFEGVAYDDILERGKKLLPVLQALEHQHIVINLTYDMGLYARAELADGTSLHVEVIMGPDSDPNEDTFMGLYDGADQLWNVSCSYNDFGSKLDEMLAPLELA